MKRILQKAIDAALFLVWFAAILGCIGCFSAQKGGVKALKKVDEANAAISTNRNQQLDRAAAFVHGANRALASETNRTPAVGLAYDLSTRAATIIGAPRYEDSVAMEAAVRGALSGVAEQQLKAAEILAKLDGQVTSLQKRMDTLHGKKADAEESRDEKLVQFAAEADFGRKVKRWMWIGSLSLGGLILAPFVLQVLSVLFPAFVPLTQLFAGILAFPFKLLMRAVPAAANAAGVVSREAHEKVEAVAVQTASAIETLKLRNRDAYDKDLRPALLSATNEDSQDTIRILKKRVRPVKV